MQPFGRTALPAVTPVRGTDTEFLEFGHLGGTPELSHRFRTVYATGVQLVVIVKDEGEHARFASSRGQQGQILTCQAGLLVGLDSSGIRLKVSFFYRVSSLSLCDSSFGLATKVDLSTSLPTVWSGSE